MGSEAGTAPGAGAVVDGDGVAAGGEATGAGTDVVRLGAGDVFRVVEAVGCGDGEVAFSAATGGCGRKGASMVGPPTRALTSSTT
ncbi:hypothetical protein GH740_08545 [Microbacterium sp. SYP-A9085]|uniref:hypothetical protein n=1 Tax=Microbacterium sp. SYP-A9085 TaxID=2664454 RepID=UPI00129B37E3|nr:hypothetical protein [Microbacterium sp. SYP-A9085]MRH29365.1 hypothetical protein [Microbacterium sp. SYP-A9085]